MQLLLLVVVAFLLSVRQSIGDRHARIFKLVFLLFQLSTDTQILLLVVTQVRFFMLQSLALAACNRQLILQFDDTRFLFFFLLNAFHALPQTHKHMVHIKRRVCRRRRLRWQMFGAKRVPFVLQVEPVLVVLFARFLLLEIAVGDLSKLVEHRLQHTQDIAMLLHLHPVRIIVDIAHIQRNMLKLRHQYLQFMSQFTFDFL
mmetsp:Transcript_43899/g.72519  ORF Transcript_43899/g.72519 Transcript_43899/m.72519 type:complete len:201 (+) Transcript_43899:861-1463(+)